MNISVKVLYFGPAADIAGKRDEIFEFAIGADVATATEKILSTYQFNNSSIAFALNQNYANGNEILKNGDELALIPPVSGG